MEKGGVTYHDSHLFYHITLDMLPKGRNTHEYLESHNKIAALII